MISFDTRGLVGGDLGLKFHASVWSSSAEAGHEDNEAELQMGLRTEADLEMVGGGIRSEAKFSQTFQVSEVLVNIYCQSRHLWRPPILCRIYALLTLFASPLTHEPSDQCYP